MRMHGKSGQSRVNVSYSPPSPHMLQPNCLQQAARSHTAQTLLPMPLTTGQTRQNSHFDVILYLASIQSSVEMATLSFLQLPTQIDFRNG